MEPESNQENKGADMTFADEPAPVKKYWATERAELQAELSKTKAALAAVTSRGVSAGLVEATITSWPGVDYTKRYISVKMSVKDNLNQSVPANGDFKKGKGPVFTFKDGRCVTNQFKEMKEFLNGRSGWTSRQYNREAQAEEV